MENNTQSKKNLEFFKKKLGKLDHSQLKTITGGDIYMHSVPGSNNRINEG